MSEKLPIAAVVVAAGGGERLARALASVSWATQRLVFDPAGRLRTEALPPDVLYAAAESELGSQVSAPWLLVLAEAETVTAELPPVLAPLVVTGAQRSRFAFGRALHSFGSELRLPGATFRLAPSAGTRVIIGRALWPEVDAPGLRGTRLRVRGLTLHLASLARAVDELEADGSAAAAMLATAGQRPHLWRLLAVPPAAGLACLCAVGRTQRRFTRWVSASVLAYRAVVVYAKLWERLHAAGEPSW